MSDKTLEQQVEKLLITALGKLKFAERKQESTERGSLRNAHYQGEEYAWQQVAETIAGFTPELAAKFGQTEAELWPEHPGGRL
jgi:hypothetical protein